MPGALLILAGIAIAMLSGFCMFGGMMSDAPAAGDAMANKGCAGVIVGLVLVAAGITLLIL